MRAASIYKFLWLVFSVLSITLVVGCSRGDDVMMCHDINCSALHRSCTDAVGTADAYCGDCSTGYFDNDGTCTEITVCTNAEYELSAPTETSDRECVTFTDCQENQYEKVAPTASSDRECAALSECHGSDRQIALSGQDIPTDGSAMHDRVCCHLYTEDIVVKDDGGWPQFDEACLYVKGTVSVYGAYEGDSGAKDAYDMMDDRLVVVEDDLDLYGYKTDLQVFKNLESIGGDFGFEYNNLVNFHGLEKLQSIGGYFILYDNTELVNFRGLENLRTIGKGFAIGGNDSLVNFEGLEQLTEIGGLNADESVFYVDDNQNLVNFQGLENLEIIHGDFEVGGSLEDSVMESAGNAKLESFEGLESLKTIKGQFAVYQSDELINFKGLESLEVIERGFFLGFIDATLNYFGNAKLLNFEGLESLKTIGQGAIIINNERLENFNGLESLETIGGWLLVGNNKHLANLHGLKNLVTVAQDFSFPGVGQGDVVFSDNDMLCEDLVDDLAAQVGMSPGEYDNVGNNGVCL